MRTGGGKTVTQRGKGRRGGQTQRELLTRRLIISVMLCLLQNHCTLNEDNKECIFLTTVQMAFTVHPSYTTYTHRHWQQLQDVQMVSIIERNCISSQCLRHGRHEKQRVHIVSGTKLSVVKSMLPMVISQCIDRKNAAVMFAGERVRSGENRSLVFLSSLYFVKLITYPTNYFTD